MTPKPLIAEVLVAAFWAELLTLSIPLFALLIFDKVIVHASFSTLYVVGAGVLVAAFFEGMLAYLYARYVHLLSARIDEHLTRPSLERLLRLPLQYFESKPKGEIASALRKVQAVRDVLSATYLSAVVDIVVTILVLLLMMVYSPLLAGIVATCVPALVLLTALLRPVVSARYRALGKSQSNYETLLDEGIQCMATIKSFALESSWRKRWTAAHGEFVHATLRARRGAAVEDAAMRVLQRLVLLAVLAAGASQVLGDELTLGQLLACYMLSVRVLLPTTRVFQIYMGLVQIRSALKDLEALHSEKEESDRPRAAPFASGDIVFRGVAFRYAPDLPQVLAGVDVTIPSGAFAGIVGPSGSGKSTLARMLQRYLSPQQGVVLVGGRDVRDIEIDSLRRHVLVVSHDASLFRTTVRENITAGRDCDDNEVWRACDAAHATEFLQQLPDGLETLLDERGAQLSSGQRQRIALARALCARPSVLVLDEATNALDTETEVQVLARIRAEFSGRTVVVVTHRPHVLRDVAHVLEVCGGSVRPRAAAVGDHRRLQVVHEESNDV